MNTEIEDPFTKLSSLFAEINNSKMRFYGAPWSDWENQSTGVRNPSVYFLFVRSKDSKPTYIGETVNLGKRLDEHDKSYNTWIDGKWQYVKYIDNNLLSDGQLRQLFECFCIYILNPANNNVKRKT